MPRYLTPSKIGLLVLASIYVDGHVSITASIPVLSFLIPHLLPQSVDTVASPRSPPTIQDFQDILSKLPSDFPGRTVWDLVLRKLWTFDSLDSLHVFFETLSNLCGKNRVAHLRENQNGQTQNDKQIIISVSSPLGVFIRRTQIEFFRLQMDDGIILWKSLLQFREPTRAMVRKRNPSLSKTGFDCNIPLDGPVHDVLYGDLTTGRFKGSNTSSVDLELLIEFYLDRIEKTGQRLSPESEEQFNQMIKLAVDAPVRLSYLKHLDAWKGGDYPSALENLHRFFDYAMQKQDRTLYQFGLLNLAMLHSEFGSLSEAITAIKETISIAREHKDIGCLNYALSWLFHFGKANPQAMEHVREIGVPDTDKEGLVFLKAKAKESGMWGLLVTSYLTEARSVQQNGESIGSAFESIAKASHLNVVKENSTKKGSELNAQSALFSRLGQRHLAWMSEEVFTTCYALAPQVEDLLNFTCRSALMEAAQGHYAQAFLLLDTIGPSITRIVHLQKSWITCNLLIKLRQSIHRTDFLAADNFLTQLQANVENDSEISFAISTYAVDLETRRGQFGTAMELIESQLSKTRGNESDTHRTIKFMVIKARLFAKAGLPAKGFSLSLRAAALAHRARYLHLLWEAIGVFSEVLCSLSEFDAAMQLLKAILPQALETEDSELIANSYSYLANAYMGLAGEGKDGSFKRKEQMNNVLECLDRAFDEYSRHDNVQGQCEMLAKKATIMHLNGDLVLANDIASKYLGIKKTAGEETREATQRAKT